MSLFHTWSLCLPMFVIYVNRYRQCCNVKPCRKFSLDTSLATSNNLSEELFCRYVNCWINTTKTLCPPCLFYWTLLHFSVDLHAMSKAGWIFLAFLALQLLISFSQSNFLFVIIFNTLCMIYSSTFASLNWELQVIFWLRIDSRNLNTHTHFSGDARTYAYAVVLFFYSFLRFHKVQILYSLLLDIRSIYFCMPSASLP